MLDARDAALLQMLRTLDRRGGEVKLGKLDRATLNEAIRRVAEALEHGEYHPEAAAIWAKYPGPVEGSFDEQEAALAKAVLEETFGVSLDDVDLSASADSLDQILRDKMDARDAADAQRASAAKPRKPSAHDARKQREAEQASQSVREVYRKLASALHSDRETDPAERERKTLLMQRVNRAWNARNLLDLLQLQLEIEQIHPHTLDALPDDRLKRFNKILAEQLEELQREVFGLKSGFIMQFDLDSAWRLRPQDLPQIFVEKLRFIRAANRDLQGELAAFDDTRALKAWLKQQRRAFDADLFDAFCQDHFR